MSHIYSSDKLQWLKTERDRVPGAENGVKSPRGSAGAAGGRPPQGPAVSAGIIHIIASTLCFDSGDLDWKHISQHKFIELIFSHPLMTTEIKSVGISFGIWVEAQAHHCDVCGESKEGERQVLKQLKRIKMPILVASAAHRPTFGAGLHARPRSVCCPHSLRAVTSAGAWCLCLTYRGIMRVCGFSPRVHFAEIEKN